MQIHIVFIGVSLADANMRTWLWRLAENRRNELRTAHGHEGNTSMHYWINRRPEDNCEAEWIEESVAHLGVRLIWIDQWSQVETALRKGLGIS